MKSLFSDLEGLRISMEIEARGFAFYSQAHKQAKTEKHRELFLLLAQEETEHLAKFTKIFNQVNENKEANTEEYLFDWEASRYLTVLAENHVFPPAAEAKAKIAELKTTKDILLLALQAEKDSILFYDELAAHAKFPEAQRIFIVLRDEEKKHVVKLQEIIRI